MKTHLGLLLAVQCSACALGGREQPPPLFVNPATREIIDCEAEGRMAGNAAELNCIVKAQQAAGYISLNNLESSASEPAPPSPAFEGQAKEKQPGIVPGVEKSRADIIEKMTVTRAGAERLLALRIEEVKKLAKEQTDSALKEMSTRDELLRSPK
jgi:hypothetical protein